MNQNSYSSRIQGGRLIEKDDPAVPFSLKKREVEKDETWPETVSSKNYEDLLSSTNPFHDFILPKGVSGLQERYRNIGQRYTLLGFKIQKKEKLPQEIKESWMMMKISLQNRSSDQHSFYLIFYH